MVRGWLSWPAAQVGTTGLNLVFLVVLVEDEILAQAVLLPVKPVMTYAVGQRWVFSRA